LLKEIQRKNNNDNIRKGGLKKKKIDFETIKKESVNICNIVKYILIKLNDLKTRVESLEGKHSFLEMCHEQLARRNEKIKFQLNSLVEKEKNLENLLLFALKNFAPNFFIKNDIKYLDSIIPDSNNSASQLVEVCL
jgi:hypothetical protein